MPDEKRVRYIGPDAALKGRLATAKVEDNGVTPFMQVKFDEPCRATGGAGPTLDTNYFLFARELFEDAT